MKKQILFMAIITVSVYGCKKENLLSLTNSDPISTNIETDDYGISSKDNELEVFHWVGTGPGELGPDCFDKGGNCFPEFIVIGEAAKTYGELIAAIENDLQMNFFSNNNYGDVYNVDEIPQIQDALEKGHLKVKIVKSSTTDFNLFIKPQHEKFDMVKLANKVVLAIPVSK